jgi:hypothetical protein
MLFVVPWFVVMVGVGIYWRDWFNRHDNVSLLVLGALGGILIAGVALISRRVQLRHGPVCRTCGRSGMLSPTGECWTCYRPRRLLRTLWPLPLVIAVGFGVVDVVGDAMHDLLAGRAPRGLGWVAGGVAVIVALAWLARRGARPKSRDGNGDASS